jgi:hypothetical protein
MQIPTLFGDPSANKQNIYLHVKNVDTTPILRGTPCIYAMSGTQDAHAVVNAVTAGANKSTAYFAGIAAKDIPVGEIGMSLISGVSDFVRCSGSMSADNALTVNPAANNFVSAGAISAIIAIATVGPIQLPPLITGNATATIDGVANVSNRVLVRGV